VRHAAAVADLEEAGEREGPVLPVGGISPAGVGIGPVWRAVKTPSMIAVSPSVNERTISKRMSEKAVAKTWFWAWNSL
jgi:hypothetical protein